jgi:hypothetical protein
VTDTPIGIGETLAAAARIAARHWLLGLIAVAAMAGMFLLLFYLAGRCIGAGTGACFDTNSFNLPHYQGRALLGDSILILTLAVEFIIASVMLRLFYRREPSPQRRYAGAPAVELGRFLRRVWRVWFIVAIPAALIDMGYLHASWAIYLDYSSPSELWIGYLVSKMLVMSFVAYLRAITVLAIPTVVYDEHPEGLLRGWERVRPVRWRLFFVFWLVELAVTLIQVVFVTLAPVAIDFNPLTGGIAAWSDLDARYIADLLPSAIIYASVAPFAILLTGGISIVAYGKLVAIDHTHAGIFD